MHYGFKRALKPIKKALKKGLQFFIRDFCLAFFLFVAAVAVIIA